MRNKKFCLIFDGWTNDSCHFLGIFAQTDIDLFMLSFSEFEDSGRQDTDGHIKEFDFILDYYNLDAENLVCVVGDNAEVNKAISRRTGVNFIGCNSHRLNLGVKIMMEPHLDLLKRISSMMSKLKTTKRWNCLKNNGCKHKPIVLHEIRWEGFVRMLRRYEKIKAYLHLFDKDLEIAALIPNSLEKLLIDQLLQQLEAIQETSKKLQKQTTKIADVRILFDLLLENSALNAVHQYLKPESDVVECKSFENAIVKLQLNKAQDLTNEEKEAVRKLKFHENQLGTDEESGLINFRNLDEILEARKKQKMSGSSEYFSTDFIHPTSNTVERLFSQAKITLGYLRKSMAPATFEAILFAKMNWKYFTTKIVSAAIHKLKEKN